MGQAQMVTSLVMIALFSIAIIGFAVNFAQDNNAAIDLADDPELSALNTDLKSNTATFESEAESSYQSIIETQIEGEVAPSAAPFAVTPKNTVSVVKNILQVGYTKIFGTNNGFSTFLASFVAMIVFLLGLFIYKTLRGIPD